MEVIGGLIASLVAMALLAGVGLMTVVALALMLVLGLLTELSFKRVFFISFGVGLLAPLLVAMGIGGAVADGSLQEELGRELADVVDVPEGLGDRWGEALPKLQEISDELDAGNISEEEAKARAKAVLGQFEGLKISVDVNGENFVIGDESGAEGDTEEGSGVPLELPEAVEAGKANTE